MFFNELCRAKQQASKINFATVVWMLIAAAVTSLFCSLDFNDKNVSSSGAPRQSVSIPIKASATADEATADSSATTGATDTYGKSSGWGATQLSGKILFYLLLIFGVPAFILSVAGGGDVDKGDYAKSVGFFAIIAFLITVIFYVIEFFSTLIHKIGVFIFF